MADVNAACDRWIAEIRAVTTSQRDIAQSRPRESVPVQREHRPSPIVFHMSYAVGTVLVAFVTMALIVMIVGTSVTEIAVGALFGSMAGAAYVAVVCFVARRE